METLYRIYPIESYTNANEKFIQNMYEEYEIENLENVLTIHNNGYHMRIHTDQTYIFFGDINEYRNTVDEFIHILISFLKKYYNIEINKSDICYTINESKQGSYHYSIPKLNCSCVKLKEIHTNIINQYPDEFKYQKDDTIVSCIDTTIYSDHWFRLPLQTKGNEKTIHKIVHGHMKDFIVEYIPENSYSIENNNYIETLKEEIKKSEKNSKLLARYRLLIDKCYKPERFDTYDSWITVGMTLKNIFGSEAFELFDYFSSKSKKYKGTSKTLKEYELFDIINSQRRFSIETLYKFAKDDNINEYRKIIYDENNTFTEVDFAEKIYELASDRFVYKKMDDMNYQLYCYNGEYWEADDLLLRIYISNELFEYYKNLCKDVYWNTHNFKNIKSRIDDMKRLPFKRNIIETYKEYGVKNIEFDEKWYLLGFNNKVYDLNKSIFRNYQKDDYISITTGYDWIEPTKEQITTLESIFDKIMPIKDELLYYKILLSTTLEGRCLEKFIVFNGGGGNGKGLIDDLLLCALGRYGIVGNNAILFEKNRTGSNPEKANLHKKRLILFREPSAKSKFENSSVKELTGGGSFSARSHHEKTTEKKLQCTVICECNKRPLFAEEPTDADVRRLVDILFRSSFTENKSILDDTAFIYEANIQFKDCKFQQEHKYALLYILMDAYKIYAKNNYMLNNFIPKSINKRTKAYLELSCDILQWFKDNYTLTKNKEKFVQLKNVYFEFKLGEYYSNLSKIEKRKYTYNYFIEYFSNNIVTKKYYKERTTNQRNILCYWEKIEQIEEIEDTEEEE